MDKDKKDQILFGTQRMFRDLGEMSPLKLFYAKGLKEEIQELVSEGEISIVKDPYGIGDDFFGIKGNKYPKTAKDLMELRKDVKDGMDVFNAHMFISCMEI